MSNDASAAAMTFTSTLFDDASINDAIGFDDLLFDSFDLGAPLDSDDAFALAATDLGDPNAFFAFATTLDDDASSTLPSSPLSSPPQSHTTDSDSSGSAAGSPTQSSLSSPLPTTHQSTTKRNAKATATTRSKKARTTGTTPSLTLHTQQSPQSPTTADKRPRKHNRLEILKLRDHIQQLEARVAALQRQSEAQRTISLQVLTTGSHPHAMWRNVALEQLAAREKAQSLNRKLRDALATQQTLANSIHTLVQTTNATHTSCLLRELLEPESEINLRAVIDATIPSLIAGVATQFLATDSVVDAFARQHDLTVSFHTSRCRPNAACCSRDGNGDDSGVAAEFVTNTPVAGAYNSIAHAIWRRIVDMKATLEPVPLVEEAHVKRVELAVATRDGDVKLHGALVIRKFVQAGRVVIAVAAAYGTSDCDAVFREQAWLVSSNTSSGLSSPAASTLLQVFYVLRCEQRNAASTTGSAPYARSTTAAMDASALRLIDRIAQGLTDHVREHALEIQRSLQTNVNAFETRAVEMCGCALIPTKC